MFNSDYIRSVSGYNITQANANSTNTINTLINMCSSNKGLQTKEITCKNGHIFCNSCKETKIQLKFLPVHQLQHAEGFPAYSCQKR